MSRMKLDRKPPLAKSPIRVRPPSLVLRSGATSLQTPPGSLTKSQKPSRMEEPDLRPEYRSISCELRALAKMVGKEFGDEDCEKAGGVRANSSPLFERGRFYEEYSARRNERLRKKYGGTGEEFKSAFKQKLGVAVESAKRGSGTRKLESIRKSVSAAYSVEPPRYMLRSMSKDNKKPPLSQPPALYSAQKSVIGGGRKTASRRVGY
ncbi:hypothetical protein RchiOBHm_Chr6g0304291 [Rosa chinensis]|uniref:Uncharacterized protein n=1 Tax=Rosa chinensis TaxID=74649 RepID=A0A2P6PZL5_ROSCH|nr:uncharacterized protein LOC112172801 [Rosa chinensis]PRQ27339.1 hypothetical protein RchiOBHm_Chr6g0304291 [Rosa chinensis]